MLTDLQRQQTQLKRHIRTTFSWIRCFPT